MNARELALTFIKVADVPERLYATLPDEYRAENPYTLQLGLRLLQRKYTLAGMPAGTLEQTLADQLFAIEWRDTGFNIFSLTDSLTAALLLTEAKLDWDSVKLPFPAYAFYVPPGFVQGRLDNSSHLTDVGLVIVHRRELNGTIPPFGSDKTAMMHVKAFGSDRDITCWIYDRALPLKKDFKASWALSAEVEKTDSDDAVLHKLSRLSLNLALWITAHQAVAADTVRPVTRPARSDHDAMTKPRVWILGREVKLSKECRDVAKQVRDAQAVEWRLKLRHVVRGHFKNQVHGTGREERRLIWVSPYWRNPDSDVAIAHLYQIDNNHNP